MKHKNLTVHRMGGGGDLAVHPQGTSRKDKTKELVECLQLFSGIESLVVLTGLLRQLCVCRGVMCAGRVLVVGTGITGGM